MWSLVVRSINEELHEIDLKPGQNILGRGMDNHIVLNDNAASNQHAEIYYDTSENTITIQDLDSTNGTFINSKRIHGKQNLQNEDQIRIGFCLITIISSEPQPSYNFGNQSTRTKVTSELILESIDNYGVLLHEAGQRLVNVPDLDNALFEITGLIKRMIGAEECQIVLANRFSRLTERGIPASIAQGIIKNKTAATFLHVPDSTLDTKKSATKPAQPMLLVPVVVEENVVALIFAKKSRHSSNTFYNSDLQLALAVGNQVAMSIQRNRVQEKLLHNSSHDALTDLPNRTFFLDRLKHSIARTKNQNRIEFAVLFFDIDNFKIVNDSLGHNVGDKLLIAMANRLRNNVRSIDTVARPIVARFGGDEFAILLDNIKESQFAIAAANRLKELLSKPFDINGKVIYATVSVGVALSTNNYEKPEDILRDADIAMYKAKEMGKERVEIYDNAMHAKVMERMRLGTALRQGVLHKEFRIYYQPIVSLKNGQPVGFEALLRWDTPHRGILKPDEFMDVIDTAGLLYTTDHWVLKNACIQIMQWQKQFPNDPPFFISVNISVKYFKHPHFVDNIKQVLDETNLDPNRLWLEITEKVSAANDESIITILENLHTMGIRISLDDFGTGYSALSYLARFPITSLKIDRSFINMIGVNDESLKIIEMIRALANHLGLILIAEGIETPNQVPFLKSIGCDYGQGYLFARPLDVQLATEYISKNHHK